MNGQLTFSFPSFHLHVFGSSNWIMITYISSQAYSHSSRLFQNHEYVAVPIRIQRSMTVHSELTGVDKLELIRNGSHGVCVTCSRVNELKKGWRKTLTSKFMQSKSVHESSPDVSDTTWPCTWPRHRVSWCIRVLHYAGVFQFWNWTICKFIRFNFQSFYVSFT